jgi:hypothetical protein
MPAGLNNAKKYQKRIREKIDGVDVLCNKCFAWKDSSSFWISKGRYQSTCKDCHKNKYSVNAGYRPPKEIERLKESKKKRQQWLDEKLKCVRCGSQKPRKDFYDPKQKIYLEYCCNIKRTEEQILTDINEQMKTCFTCGLRLPFSEFGSANTRDGRNGSCKCCRAAMTKISGGTSLRRRNQKIETDDGSITVLSLSKMLRETNHCPICNVEMNQDYPATNRNKTIDHNLPLSRGGKHTIENISIMCLGCNSRKQTRTLDEFQRNLKKKVPIE